MKFRKLDMKTVSADNLPKVRCFLKMKVYAEVYFNGEPKTSIRTTVDMAGERNPKWDLQLNYTINKASLRKPGLEVVVKLYCKRTRGDKYISEVKIPVKALFARRRAGQEASFDVAGTGNGKLNILYSFGRMFRDEEPSCWVEAIRAGLRVLFVVMVQGTWFALSGGI
ncbi:uncharacterized protein LOC125203587 [Salvia hispanica]|uniref:uncharacterized protein LOC125203587 n=1 Tax=Salvia hispanica TaxID=49212 RepID=UPI0020098C63|nr:uncharacterized protein LOC125203587 [Salvia hispanica]